MIHQINMCSKDVDAVWFVWWDSPKEKNSGFHMFTYQDGLTVMCKLGSLKSASEKESEVKECIEKTSYMV